MATDIAFAVVVLGALGSRVPNRLKLFLLSIAIVDDIGAILVIALFYSEHIAFGWLLGALGVIVVIVLAQRLGLGHPVIYGLPAVALWVCTHESGVHATIAGVVLAILTPARPSWPRCPQGPRPLPASVTASTTSARPTPPTRRCSGSGERVVLDATFHDPSWRAAATQLADEAVADLTALRCVAPVEVAVARAARRLAAGADVSDAHEAVVRAMAAAEVPWPAATTIDSNGAPDAAISAAVAAVERGA